MPNETTDGQPEDAGLPRRVIPLEVHGSPSGDLPPVEAVTASEMHNQPPVVQSDNESATTPEARTAERSQTEEPYSGVLLSRISWLLFALILVLMVRWMLPTLVEELRYGMVRGEQRAKYEVASEVFKDDPLRGLSQYYAGVSEIAGPSVVHINTTSAEEDQREDELSHFFGPKRREALGQGSGVIMDKEGYVVTNFHVIRGSREIQVVVNGSRPRPATVVGVDPPTDLAVLKISGSDLIPATWADSDQLEVGTLVWAVGSPFGLERTITAGILSAKNRAGKAGTVYQDFLQTDAAVNPGNSGGPLVDAKGRVIGINTAIVGQTYQGISFAIPSNVARDVYARLLANGSVARGWLGVHLDEVTPERAARFGVKTGKGAFILDVVSGPDGKSPAREAGIQRDDIVISWNNLEINSPMDLSRQVARTEVGNRAEVVVVRQGREIRLQVTVGRRAPGL